MRISDWGSDVCSSDLLHLDSARAAANDSQWDLAYRIAADTNAYSPGTVLRDQPYAERDVLTSLEWLAGWTAYKNLGRPASAVVHFDRYSLAAQTPQTQSKGDYWAGRAAEADRKSTRLHSSH